MRAELAQQQAKADAQLAHFKSATDAAQSQSEEAHKLAAAATERCSGAEAREAATLAKVQRLSRSLEEADDAHKVPLPCPRHAVPAQRRSLVPVDP